MSVSVSVRLCVSAQNFRLLSACLSLKYGCVCVFVCMRARVRVYVCVHAYVRACRVRECTHKYVLAGASTEVTKKLGTCGG